MAHLLTKYNKMLNKRPLITKMITSGVISGIGDIMCQLIE